MDAKFDKHVQFCDTKSNEVGVLSEVIKKAKNGRNSKCV